MSRNFLAFLAAISLAACSAPDNQNTSAPASAGPASATAAADPQPAPSRPNGNIASAWCKSSCGELPPGVVVAIAHPLHSDRSYTLPNGENRRQVAFEFTQGTAASTMEAIDASMRAAGFEGASKPARPDGVLAGLYKKAGTGNVNVWVNPALPPKPVNASAMGIFGFDYPVQSSPH